ncbi:hypothetical protein [uncultured Croceitalea sp.]|uniref:hypothetical protein n=1 Tax=uncultured Croceitalea sp. TaxID=1798908 RepID=UPI0033067B3E
MSDYKMPTKFAVLLGTVLSVVFGIHIAALHFLQEELFGNLIVAAYIINYVLAALIFFVLFYYRIKLQNAIGFLFMGGSFLKFIFFFLIFYPVYKNDGEMQRLEFAAFFVPYLTALILETFHASKMLNQLEKPKD